MYSFSQHSLDEHATLHEDLQKICDAAIQRIDFRIQQGLRGEAEQNRAQERVTSHLRFPLSHHNASMRDDGTLDPARSDAMDLWVWPVEWPDKDNDTGLEYARKKRRWFTLAIVILEEADRLGVPLKWGGTWHSLEDLPHFQRRRT